MLSAVFRTALFTVHGRMGLNTKEKSSSTAAYFQH